MIILILIFLILPSSLIMSVPSFTELDRPIRELFKEYNRLGLVDLIYDRATSQNAGLKVKGQTFTDNGDIALKVVGKRYLAGHRVVMKGKWIGDKGFSSEIAVKDSLSFLKGISGHFNSSLDVGQDGSVIHGAGVIQLNSYITNSWIYGAQFSMDPIAGEIKKTNIAIGYKTPSVTWLAKTNDGKEAIGTGHLKMGDNLETGVFLILAKGKSPSFGVGCKYKLSDKTWFRAKVNDNGKIVLGLTYRLSPHLLFTLTMPTPS